MATLSEAKESFTRAYGCKGRFVRSNLAYRDLTPRTIAGLKRIDKGQKEQIRKAKELLADELMDWLLSAEAPANQEEFDRAHDALCSRFLDRYNEVLAACGLPEQAYGKAQKIVNMALKYLYCFDDGAEIDGWLRFGHLPIDTLTLRWCRESGMFTGGVSWGRLTKREYDAFQRELRAWLARAKPTVDGAPLPERLIDAETVIWDYEKRLEGKN